MRTLAVRRTVALGLQATIALGGGALAGAASVHARGWLGAPSAQAAAAEVVASPAASPPPRAAEPTPERPAAPAATPEAPPATERTAPLRVVVQAAGDYLLHARVQESARHHGGFAYLTAALAAHLAQGDVNLVNLETPLAAVRNEPSASPPVLAGPAEAAVGLRASGFHAAVLANNHAYDQTLAGVRETVDAVRAAGLLPVGGGLDAEEARTPQLVRVCADGARPDACARVALLAFTETVNAGSLVSRLPAGEPQVALWKGSSDLAQVRRAAAEADVVVVAMHWGDELSAAPTRAQQRAARQLCDAGAHVVAGSHPHVLQPVVRLPRADGAPCVVAYSLGNLVSNQGLKYKRGGVEPVAAGSAEARGETRDGALLRVTLAATPGGGPARVIGVEAVPLFTHNNWLERFGDPDFRNDIFVAPIAALLADPARARHHALYRERLGAIAAALGPSVTLAD